VAQDQQATEKPNEIVGTTSGGSPVSVPARKGFGSSLIEQSFSVEGKRCGLPRRRHQVCVGHIALVISAKTATGACLFAAGKLTNN
jgi:hypothetical protein